MSDKKIIFVNQEMAPYLPADEISTLGRNLAIGMHKRKYEVRTFMPKFGDVNERRNQLHEVIRLSGMNISINDADHPLIIKVASLQPARIQVYFIDNDDYFQKEESDSDVAGSNRDDNDERAIFFARGTVETIRKLKWEPGIIHCSGWVSAVVPVMLRGAFAKEPAFKESKVVYSVQAGDVSGNVDPEMMRKLIEENIPVKALADIKDAPTDGKLFHRLAIAHADGVIFETPEPDPELLEYIERHNIPYITKEKADEGIEAYAEFYESL